ncbi:MAG: EF-P beta-lysylation protein EpmB [Acidobacteriota bacterium]
MPASPGDRANKPAKRSVPLWQRHLAGAVSSLGELVDRLDLQMSDLAPTDVAPPEVPGTVDATTEAERDFPLRVPRGFVDRMRRGDPRDPLLLQVLPTAAETLSVAGYSRDPLAEERAGATPGLLHKYRGRVLLVVTGACAIHCRYCFRRHFPYGDHSLWGDAWHEAVHYVASDPSLHEVILSGGDPLVLTDDKLARLGAALEAIPHLRRLRLHTRLPIVLPERVDDNLLAWLTSSRLQPVVVVHANHPNEIDTNVQSAFARLRSAGITLLNQTVLLAGINDDAATLCELSEALFAAGALPYYLHLPDPVSGTAHFAVDDTSGQRLLAEMMRRLPGYLVPRLVREDPNTPAKRPVGPLGL